MLDKFAMLVEDGIRGCESEAVAVGWAEGIAERKSASSVDPPPFGGVFFFFFFAWPRETSRVGNRVEGRGGGVGITTITSERGRKGIEACRKMNQWVRSTGD